MMLARLGEQMELLQQTFVKRIPSAANLIQRGCVHVILQPRAIRANSLGRMIIAHNEQDVWARCPRHRKEGQDYSRQPRRKYMALFFEHGNSTVRQMLEGDVKASGPPAKGHYDKENSNSYGWISHWTPRCG